jgi:N-methylhydantoinase A/oxoprolinase/acetone carboxylase beta subunit
LKAANITNVAIVGVFSALDHTGAHEERCKSLLQSILPSLSVTCSHTIGGPGLLTRENATILNASILPLARRTIHGFQTAMAQLSLACPLYLTTNEGTLMSASSAAELPIRTFASGPTNSMTGAAFLAGLDEKRNGKQIIVVDIGGTTTDAGALMESGFPRQAPGYVEVGGVRTAFSMPAVKSIGLGGGSRVVLGEDDTAKVGPESVGHELTTKALVFGGDVLTATDIVVASEKSSIGDTTLIKDVSSEVISQARKRVKAMLEKLIEDMKVSAEPATVLLVGGGSIVQMDELDGVAECIIPPHHDSANAVGAAIAKVAGEVDVIEILEGKDEATVVEQAKQKAIQLAVEKGADTDVQVVELEKVPLQYVSNKATRLIVKAVGKLAIPKSSSQVAQIAPVLQETLHEDNSKEEPENQLQQLPEGIFSTKPSSLIDIAAYKPDVRKGVWYLSDVDLEFIASGTGVLGTGGGGPSYIQYLVGLHCLHNGGAGKLRIISLEALKDSDIVSFGSWYGAPSVSGERIPAGTEIMAGIDALNGILGIKEFDAVMADEIGGGNG